MKLAGLSQSVRAPSDYGGNAYCLQFYGMLGMPAAYNCMVWLPTIVWYGGYRCLQLYGMVGTGQCLQLYGMPAYNSMVWWAAGRAVAVVIHLQFRRLSLARPPTKPNSSHTDHLQKKLFCNSLDYEIEFHHQTC